MPKEIEVPYKKLAELVKEAREARELSQRQLSATIEMSGSYIANLEKGNIQPTVKTLKKISHTLRLPYAVLACLLYTSPSPRDRTRCRMPSSA